MLVENKFRYAAQLMKKAGIHNYDDLVNAVKTIKRQAADKVIKDIQQSKPLQTGRGRALERRMSAAYDKNKDLAPGLFEERQVILERLIQSVIRSAARQVLRNKALAKQVKPPVPKTLKFNVVHHGTTKQASDAITKSGWRTDTNVTRQMAGSNVYTSNDPRVGVSYSQSRAAARGDDPALRSFRVPNTVYKQQTSGVRGGAGDYSGRGYKMTTLTPQQANRYDITQQVQTSQKYDPKFWFTQRNQADLNQRVRAALQNPRARRVLNRDIRQGQEASLTNVYRNVRQNPSNPNTLENELRRYRGKGARRQTNEQLAPLEKVNQLPGKYSKMVVTTDTPADRMKSLKNRVDRYGKGLQRMSDIYPNYP